MEDFLRNAIRHLKPFGTRNIISSAYRRSEEHFGMSQLLRNRLTRVLKPRPYRYFNMKQTEKLKSLRENMSERKWLKGGFVIVGISGGFFSAYYSYNRFTELCSTNGLTTANCDSEAIITERGEELANLDSELDNIKKNNSFDIQLKLYQYQSCPFCCKVRAFLDYYGIQYEKIEVNPLMRTEIKFSEYRKVPIAIVDDIQLNDSSLIISILRSYMLGKGSLETLLKYYPKIESGEGRKKKTEYSNRHNVMYMEAMPNKEQQEAVREEAKWRRWVDDTFVHMLSPNIYRTMAESFQAFEYFSDVGNFSATDRFLAKNCGAVFMYIVSKRLKKRYNLKDNVRESLYDEARKWSKAVGKKRKFMGGNKPNLADLSVYGVLSGIEGLDAFQDLMNNTDIKPWYDRVKKTVQLHQGHEEYTDLVEKLGSN